MKIEIDLNDILGDEFGSETMQESIKRQIIERLTKKFQEGLNGQINQQITVVVDAAIKEQLKGQMPEMVAGVMDMEYIPIDRFGSKSEPTTFRKQLITKIMGELVYIPKSYDSEKNIFTRAVDGALKDNIDAFKKAYNKVVDEQFINEAFNHATEKLKKTLGIK